jgi:ribosomal protein S18 acetylase RimI-like enzyme
MMNFEIKENVIPDLKDLIDLYNIVGWKNYTNNPDMLEKAYENSLYILTAWDKEKLIGALRIVGDGYSIIYIQDIVVLEEYQHTGIGSKLMTDAISKYKNVYQKVLLTENESSTKAFYEKIGFVSSDKYGCVSYVKFSM